MLYRVTAEFGPTAIVMTTGLAAAILYVFDDACLGSLGGGATPRDACLAVARPDRGLTCQYTPNQCRCEAVTEPLQSGQDTIPYTRDGNRITMGSGARAATGSYCVEGERLTIHFPNAGYEGWQSWIFARAANP